MIDLRHLLAVLSTPMPLPEIEKSLAPLFEGPLSWAGQEHRAAQDSVLSNLWMVRGKLMIGGA